MYTGGNLMDWVIILVLVLVIKKNHADIYLSFHLYRHIPL